MAVVREALVEEEGGGAGGRRVLQGRVGSLGVGSGEEMRVRGGEPVRGLGSGEVLGRRRAPQYHGHHGGVYVHKWLRSEENPPGLPDGGDGGGTGVVLRHPEGGRGGACRQGGRGCLHCSRSDGGDQLGSEGRSGSGRWRVR